MSHSYIYVSEIINLKILQNSTMLTSYARPSNYTDDELLEDNVRVILNQQALVKTGSYFAYGIVFGAILAPTVVFADDSSASAQIAKSKAKKEFAKRISNTSACSAIALVCGKAAAKNADKAVDVASKAGVLTNPQLLAAFGCGVAVSWCLKYAIFDK